MIIAERMLEDVRKEGILRLEEFMEYGYLGTILRVIINAAAYERVVEIGTNEYWARNPQGIQAMVHFFLNLRNMWRI